MRYTPRPSGYVLMVISAELPLNERTIVFVAKKLMKLKVVRPSMYRKTATMIGIIRTHKNISMSYDLW